MNGKKVTGEAEFPDGHKGKALENGQCAICTECKPIRGRFGKELDANPHLNERLKKLEDQLKNAPDVEKPKRIAQQKAIHDELMKLQQKELGPKVKKFEDRMADPQKRSKISKEEWQEYYRNKRKLDSHNTLRESRVAEIDSRMKQFEDRVKNGEKISKKDWEDYHRDKRVKDQLNIDIHVDKFRKANPSAKVDDDVIKRIKQELEDGKVFNEQSGRFGYPKDRIPQGNPALADRVTVRPETRKKIAELQAGEGHVVEINGEKHLVCPNTLKVLPNYPKKYPARYAPSHPNAGKPHPKAGQPHPTAGEPMGDIRHKKGHKWSEYINDPRNKNKSRQQVIEDQNVAKNYFFEDPSGNRSHLHE